MMPIAEQRVALIIASMNLWKALDSANDDAVVEALNGFDDACTNYAITVCNHDELRQRIA